MDAVRICALRRHSDKSPLPRTTSLDTSHSLFSIFTTSSWQERRSLDQLLSVSQPDHYAWGTPSSLGDFAMCVAAGQREALELHKALFSQHVPISASVQLDSTHLSCSASMLNTCVAAGHNAVSELHAALASQHEATSSAVQVLAAHS